MATLSIPNTFVQGTVINSAPFNQNFNAVVTAVNSIDNTNIGAAGLYASNLIPTNASQATFGGTSQYAIGVGGLTIGGNTIVTNNLLISTSNSGGYSATGIAVNGDVVAQGSASAGGFVAGGGTDAGRFSYNAGAWSLSGQSANSLKTTMVASQSTPGLLVNGAASITGNLLQVDLLSGGTHALTVTPVGSLILNSNPNPNSIGDFGMGRAAATAFIFMGTSTTTGGRFDFGGQTANQYSLMLDPTAPSYAPVNGGAYTNASDAAFKSNIAPISSGTSEVMALKPSSFIVKNTGLPGLGFIAQDVHQVLPELVSTDKDGMMGVCYDGIIPVLVKAFQETQDRLRAAGVAGF